MKKVYTIPVKKNTVHDVVPTRIALGLLVVVTLLALACMGLVYELAGTKPIVSCYFLQTQTNAKAFIKSHPQYAKQLDRDGDGKPCENLPK